MEAFKNFYQVKLDNEVHNQKFERGETTFKRGVNRFADLTEEELKKIASGFMEPKFRFQLTPQLITTITSTTYPPAPPSVDWRRRGKVSEVKDQGFFCNCCWAFSTLAGLESHLMILTGKLYDLSAQQLLDCNRNQFSGNWGCDGGSQASAFVYIKEMGIQATETYPYDDFYHHDGIYPCRYNSSLSIGKVDGYYRIRPKDEETVKRAVAFLGPIIFAFNGQEESFMYYSSGIYDEPSCKRLGND